MIWTAKQFRTQILFFLDKDERNRAYIVGEHLSAYLRKASRWIGEEMVSTLDFANLSVDELPGVQGAMYILEFVQQCEQICTERRLPFYIECVHNPPLQKFFERRGYQLFDELNHCYLRDYR